MPPLTVIGPPSSDHSPTPSRKSEESHPFINLRMLVLHRPDPPSHSLPDPNSTSRPRGSGRGSRKPLRRSHASLSVISISSLSSFLLLSFVLGFMISFPAEKIVRKLKNRSSYLACLIYFYRDIEVKFQLRFSSGSSIREPSENLGS